MRHDTILVQPMRRWNPVNESFHTVCKIFASKIEGNKTMDGAMQT